MLIRVFGSNDCEKCKELLRDLQLYKMNFVFVDANDDKNQELCDLHDVDELPHVQVIRNKNILAQYIGSESVLQIRKLAKKKNNV